VILVDVNILVYATNNAAHQHAAAREWLDLQLTGVAPVGLPWAALLALVRLGSNPRVFPRPLTVQESWGQVISWLAAEPVWIPQPTERHAEILGALLAQPGVYGNLVPDAHLATLAIEHGLTLYSTDGDFARFKQLRWINPIAS
jgi:toxin-antitoxin system PIN domain toxin